jgi:uncharacterized protein DUF3325
MSEAALLAVAFVCSLVGFAWLALAMEAHWLQVRGRHFAHAATALRLRVLGGLALAVSLALCLAADHPSMAALVWIMSLTGGALAVTFMLSWRSRLLAPLVAWAR